MSKNLFLDHVREGWQGTLRQILERARSLGSQAVLAFDLDSTLFDNRPRQARIVREFGQAHGVPALLTCATSHFDSGWDLQSAFQKCGLTESEAAALMPKMKPFWVERFFTSPYCLDDEPITGATAFVQAIAQAGAQLCYVTGRHEGMREGTIGSMRNAGMPLPGGNVRLFMKPTLDIDDDDYKRIVHAELPKLGTVIAAFDNEPTHVNDYRQKFPEASIVHLATDHSGRPVAVLEGIVSVPHFGHE